MLPEERTMEIEFIQRRFQSHYEIDISPEQAALIYHHENPVSQISNSFSTWEGVDFELTYLKEILDPSQLVKISTLKKEEVKYFEKSLADQDEEVVKQWDIIKEVVVYYNEKLLPSLFADYTLFFYVDSVNGDFVRSKINFLKAEYKKYLDNRKKEIYLSHVRHSRTFQPNLLKYALLHHELNCLFPDYYLFREQMDEPTKFIKNYLMEKLRYYAYTIDEKLKAILQELKAFNAEVVKKYYGEGGVRGWHSAYIPSEEQEKEYRLMCMVLLDRDKYAH